MLTSVLRWERNSVERHNFYNDSPISFKADLPLVFVGFPWSRCPPPVPSLLPGPLTGERGRAAPGLLAGQRRVRRKKLLFFKIFYRMYFTQCRR